MNNKIVLFGAGGYGIKALNLLGRENIAFFIDNNTSLNGTDIEGIGVKLFCDITNDVLSKYDIVISVSKKYYFEIEQCLKERHIFKYDSINSFILKQYLCCNDWTWCENRHKNRRCFLIGSGPSLKIEDLNKLKENREICFAANKIFKIFELTTWRPDYYLSTDRRIIRFYQKDIAALQIPKKMIAFYEDEVLQDFYKYIIKDKAVSLFGMYSDRNGDEVGFSSHPENGIVEGRTVIYAMIQFAAIMGFSEMYLIGVDFSYNDVSGQDKMKNDHFCKDYIVPGEEVLMSPKEYCLHSFESAEHYSKEHGFRIFNATRGGKLEVFERVNFDDLF